MGPGLKTRVCEVGREISWVRSGGGPGRDIGSCGEEGKHRFVDMNFEAAGGEDVSSDVKLAGVGGDEERWVDVWLCDEMAEVGGDNIISSFLLFFLVRFWLVGLIVRIRSFGLPFLKYRLKFFFCTEKSDSLTTVAHPGL